MNFNGYKFRASQCHLIAGGTIGLTEKQEATMRGHLQRKKLAALGEKDENGKVIKPLPPSYVKELEELQEKYKDKTLPKTMQTELRKIWRSERHKRNFLFTNKYVQKGILQEEEAITLYQKYRKEVLGINTFFTKNNIRLKNDWFSGEWDLPTLNEIKKIKQGFDIKSSWSLDTFPFKEDELDPTYLWQNQVYMDLTGADKWTTVYCLVNGTEYLVFNEKQKHFYALNQPNEDDRLYPEYIEKCRDVEKMMIFDYDRFIETNPYHIMEISKDEWYGEGYDIPLEERVIEKTVERDDEALNFLKERIKISRDYLNKLN